MNNQGIIFYIGEHNDKCETCVQAKMNSKNPFLQDETDSTICELDLDGQLIPPTELTSTCSISNSRHFYEIW